MSSWNELRQASWLINEIKVSPSITSPTLILSFDSGFSFRSWTSWQFDSSLLTISRTVLQKGLVRGYGSWSNPSSWSMAILASTACSTESKDNIPLSKLSCIFYSPITDTHYHSPYLQLFIHSLWIFPWIKTPKLSESSGTGESNLIKKLILKCVTLSIFLPFCFQPL